MNPIIVSVVASVVVIVGYFLFIAIAIGAGNTSKRGGR